MKILVVSQCFWPDIYAVSDIVENLVQRGHTVTVLTGLPDYTTSTIPAEYRHGKNRRQNYRGARVIRCPVIARHHGALYRSLNYMSFAVSGWWYASTLDWEDFDAIYVWQVTPVTMAIPAIRLKKRYHKPLFLYCLDLWPESVKAAGITENKLPYRGIHRLSNWIYRNCDHIAVSSESFFEYLEDVNGYPPEKMSYLPQYGSSAFLGKDLRKIPDGHIDFLFVGNIGKATDIDVILEACALVKKKTGTERMRVHIVGHGSEYENSVALAQRLGLEDTVMFYGAVPAEKALDFYRKADACLLTLNGDNKIGDTLPGKLQTYMAAGKPVLAAINGSGRQVIEESGCGACVPAGDAQGLAGLMQAYISAPQRFSQCGSLAKAYFERKFTKMRHFELLEKQLLRLTGGGNSRYLYRLIIFEANAAHTRKRAAA